MKRFFGDLPDTACLAEARGRAYRPPRRDAAIPRRPAPFPDYAAWVPLPASHLDFTGPWSAWRAAMEG